MFTFARNRCSRSLGIGVHVRSESVFTFSRNRCSRSVGIGVHVRSESVFTFSRNMQEALSKKESSTTREVIIEICLADYHTATARERVRIVGSLSNWAFTRESAWDTLVELVDREPMTPILKDSFVLPVLREERKRPSKSPRRPRKDERDFRIFTAVNVLTKYHGYSLTKAYKAVAKVEKESSYQTIRSKYRTFF